MSDGSSRERELVNTLERVGYAAMRCPSSGSATPRNLPDVLAGIEHWDGKPALGVPVSRALAIELKSGSSTTLYVAAEEVAALKSFADRFGATPLLGARFTSQSSPVKIYGVRPPDARKTDEGNYGLPESDIQDRATVVWTPPVGDREPAEAWV